MANTVTLATLRARALDYADMTGSSFPVQARVTDYVNQALSELHYALCNADLYYDSRASTITLVAGTENYALPTDFFKARRVWWKEGSGVSQRRWEIELYNEEEIDGLTPPVDAGTVELQYYPLFTPFVDTTDDAVQVDSKIPALPPGWEDYVALSAAIRLCAREKDLSQELRAERERVMQQIMIYAAPRDLSGTETIGDAYRRWQDNPQSYGYATRCLKYRIKGANIFFVEDAY